MRCVRCQSSGVCPPCRGSGRSGFFLTAPVATSPLCWSCRGSGKCDHCHGTGQIQYEPRIYVEHSRLFPTSVTCAAATGGFWRYIKIPSWVQRQNEKAQLRWVRRRARNHFLENHGKLHLFGNITGYRFDVTEDTSIELDTSGRYLKTVHWVPARRSSTPE